MFDPQMLNEEAIKVGVEVLKNIVESAFKNSSSFIKGKSKEYDILGKGIKRYTEALVQNYNFVKILGMSEPRPLKSLYVRANVLEKITNRERTDVNELHKLYGSDSRGFGKQVNTYDALELLNQHQKIIVLGKPGAGKSTLLKIYAMQCCDAQSKVKDKKLPIFINLKLWSDEKSKLLPFMVQEFDNYHFEEAEDFLKRLLEDGKCLLLLDGLDEVSNEHQERVIKEVVQFSQKYDKNQFVISCRLAAYNHWFQQFKDVEIADFNDAQIEQFIKNWFAVKKMQLGSDCWNNLKNNKALKELANSPLLLTLLCIVYEEGLDFPKNRAELYEEGIDTLLKKWDSTRLIKREDKYKQLSQRNKKTMLSRIAFETFTAGEYFIEEKRLTKLIGNFIENLPETQADKVEIDSEEILKSMEANHGLLVERAHKIHSFSHLTFQEYFTAKYLAENFKEYKHLFENYLHKDSWREVFLLTVGSLSNADDFMEQMLEHNFDFVQKNEGIKAILQTINTALLPANNTKYSIEWRKAGALYFIFVRELELEFDLNYTTTKFTLVRKSDRGDALDLTVASGHAIALGLALEVEFEVDFARALAGARDLDFDPDIQLDLYLFKKEYKNILHYLTAQLRMVECVKANAYISKQVRERIMRGLLSLPEETEPKE